jgi:hypothetical protein
MNHRRAEKLAQIQALSTIQLHIVFHVQYSFNQWRAAILPILKLRERITETLSVVVAEAVFTPSPPTIVYNPK